MTLRLLLLFAGLLWSLPGQAQPRLQTTRVAEQAADLARPHDAALSADGKFLYLTDMANSRIVILEAMTLKTLATFGTGELSYPHDAEFDAAGRLLVADTGNDRIAIYEVSGPRARLVGEIGGLAAPEGVAVTADGRVLATNVRSGTLSVFREGKLLRTVGQQGERDGEFSHPHDVDVAADGTIHVVDSGNHRVQVFDASLAHRASFGPELQLSGPKYLSLEKDRIWLADEYHHRILLLDHQYRLLGVLGTGKAGRGANAFNKPEAVVARAPYLWVIDTYNDRVLLLQVR
jgi:6-phosphogluconolactonase (cycloisomerase 2 family)